MPDIETDYCIETMPVIDQLKGITLRLHPTDNAALDNPGFILPDNTQTNEEIVSESIEDQLWYEVQPTADGVYKLVSVSGNAEAE